MIEELSRPEVVDFILEHENNDPSELVLSRSKYPNIPVQLAAAQIQSRKKARKKLPEWYATQGVLFPIGVSIEQCSSEITAKYKAGLVSGNSLLDLTGGTGVDTYYLSRSFSNSTYVEQQPELCDLTRHNYNCLSKKIQVINDQAEKFLDQLKERVDCIYLDPARRDENNQKVFRIEDSTPDVSGLQLTLLSKAKCILIKFSPLLDLSKIIRSLNRVNEIHVVSVENECKELLVLMSEVVTELQIITVNYNKGKEEQFKFSLQNENEVTAALAMPQNYLYEPNSSIMKAGAFKSISSVFGIKKIHDNSHLYTSENPIAKFPGRVFKILGVEAVKKTSLMNYLTEGKANIAIRNFPMSVEQIKKKMKIKDGGDIYIFATTLMSGEPRLIICEKIFA